MSGSLFEIQRIWDAWPNIRNQKGLKDLLREMSSDHPGQDLKISNIFVIPGHIFVAISAKNSIVPKCGASLYVFSCTPLSEHGESHCMTTDCILELSRQCTEVLNVIDGSSDSHSQIYVVQNNGELATYRYNPISQHWTLNESYQLATRSNSILHSCCFIPPPNSSRHSTRVFLYCERTLPPSSSAATPSSATQTQSYDYQVVLKRCEIAPNGSFIMGQSTILLVSCPPFQLVSFSDGICLVPIQSPFPHGLLLFWAPGKGNEMKFSIRAYVWNLTTPTSSPYDSFLSSSSSPLNFKSVILQLAASWSNAAKEPHLLSIASHPVTNQLLALDSTGGIHTLSLAITGTVKRTPVLSLSDFSISSVSTPDLFSFPSPSTRLQLFNLYTCYGVVINGDIRLYDSFSGEFLWESNEHEGAGFKFWTMHKSPGSCGLYGESGMWIIRSQKAADHAHFMARGIFPVKTNADETTPGEYLEEGQLIAAKLCKLWGLHLLATKFSLEAAYDTVKQTSADRNEDGSVKGDTFNPPKVPTELISLLDEESSLQNPALLVALLAEFPAYRQELTKRVERFLSDYKNSKEEQVNSLSTPLNAELVPLFEKYLELSKECEQLLNMKSQKSITSSNVRTTVCELLRKAEHISTSAIDTTDLIRSQLHSLCESYPKEALSGVKDFFGITSFHDAVEQLNSGQWQSQRNWKEIFATEAAARIERSYLKPSTNHIPLFEETCRLLNHVNPSELLTFVNFAQLVRDHQAQGDSAFARKCRKDFFYHRAINALPTFVSMEETPAEPEAIKVYCKLLLNSDHLNPEIMSIELLLSNHLWEDAIKLVEDTTNPENQCFLFHCLLSGLSKGGVLSKYIDRAWKLLPSKFSVFDFLNILKTGSSNSVELAISEDSALTVSSVAPKLLELLQQATTLIGNS